MLFVYLMAPEEGSPTKVGVTANVERRLSVLRECCPYDIKVMHEAEFPQDMALRVERGILRTFRAKRMNSEWIDAGWREVAERIPDIQHWIIHGRMDTGGHCIPDWLITEIEATNSWGGAIDLMADVGGFATDAELAAAIGIDQARFSRIRSGKEGILWSQIQALMDAMGNEVLVLWMAHQCGYDLRSARRLESETEKDLQRAMELVDGAGRELEHLRRVNQSLTEALRGNQ